MEIQVSHAIQAEFPVILNNLPPEWFEPAPYLLHLQIADMINSNRLLIAHTEDELAGVVGWQTDVAFGSYYAKFLYVKPKFQRHGVALRLTKALAQIAAETGQRAVFWDAPEGSPVLRAMHKAPGVRDVGSIDSFHEKGVVSTILQLDINSVPELVRYADQEIARITKNGSYA